MAKWLNSATWNAVHRFPLDRFSQKSEPRCIVTNHTEKSLGALWKSQQEAHHLAFSGHFGHIPHFYFDVLVPGLSFLHDIFSCKLKQHTNGTLCINVYWHEETKSNKRYELMRIKIDLQYQTHQVQKLKSREWVGTERGGARGGGVTPFISCLILLQAPVVMILSFTEECIKSISTPPLNDTAQCMKTSSIVLIHRTKLDTNCASVNPATKAAKIC